jgi:uncharacterized protein (TIGR01777 family)
MHILVAGASGFLGHALVPALRAAGHDVHRLVRTAAAAPDAIAWDPARHVLEPELLDGVDAVVNLAGENIAAGRWTKVRRSRILRSRVDATTTIIDALSAMRRRPAILINASAVGWYGDRGDEELTESSRPGTGFLPDVCQAWEQQAEQAVRLGMRTVVLRLGTILAADGGALGKMLPLFRLGLGGRLGRGEQWMSWVARDDVIGIIEAALADVRYAGPLNVVAPYPVRNRGFTIELARALHRPTFAPVPAWALRIAFGRMADEALLASTRAVPERLLRLGYRFKVPTLTDAFRSL